MPRIVIDGRAVEVEPGRTVLDAARKLGLDIPSLCYLESCGPMTSCLVCVVRLRTNGQARVVPACGTRAEDGMIVESETDEVRALRRTALELLLSDHVGDCLSPCQRICPLDLNIPRMIRQIETGDLEAAVATVRRALALPAVLGRLCHAPCQNGCRRAGCGGSAAIRDLERYVADHDLGAAMPHLPPRRPSTGKRVAVVGAGPAGLAAAYFLLCAGHECVVLDRHDMAGGSLRSQVASDVLPPEVLDAELAGLERLGARFELGRVLGDTVSLEDLEQRYDAVLIATGGATKRLSTKLGLDASTTGLAADPDTGIVRPPKVFAAGSAVRPAKQLVRAMSDGQTAAESIHRHLAGLPLRRAPKAFSSVMGRISDTEMALFLKYASPASRTEPAGGPGALFSPEEASGEAQRCLHCDCRAAGSCDLQRYAELYGANPNRFPRQRRAYDVQSHPADVIFEPGKCILCGICVHIAKQAAEPLGLTFVGRGFNVQVAAPWNAAFAEGLKQVAAECVAQCPTGAIVFREGKEKRAVRRDLKFQI